MSKREDRGAGPLQHFLEIDTGPAEGFQAKKHHDGLVKKYHGSQSVISRSFIVTDDSSHFLWKSESVIPRSFIVTDDSSHFLFEGGKSIDRRLPEP
jgi:hypothetical protein